MRDLKELAVLLLGFAPWLLFLFLSGHTLEQLEIGILIGLCASLTFGFGELRRGFILQWGTLLFFSSCAVLVNLLSVLWLAEYMDLIANAVLAGIMWLGIVLGRPFALQYARRDRPREQWNDPGLVRGCRFISLVWACLMSLSVLVSILRRTSLGNVPDWIFFCTSLCIIATGLTFTTLYKRQKRLQREQGTLSQPAGR